MNTKTIVIYLIVVVLIVIGAYALNATTNPSGPGQLDGFAQCLKTQGAVFYGAFWCPHCQNQKAMFGSSVKYLPYVECSLPSGTGQTQICIDKKIQSYPTWVFPDGTQTTGETPLTELAAKTGCVLPGSSTATSTATSTPASATIPPSSSSPANASPAN